MSAQITSIVSSLTSSASPSSSIIEALPVSNISEPLQTILDDLEERDTDEVESVDSELDDSEEADNYYEAPRKSVTRNMSSDQLLDAICLLTTNVMARHSDCNLGTNTRYEEDEDGDKIITISNIVFEVNRVVGKSIRIIKHKIDSDESRESYTASVGYCTSHENYWTGPTHFIQATHANIREAISTVYTNLKMLRNCGNCSAVYDTSVSDHCVTCLFSDYFTKENPNIKCIICTERTRDFITIRCGHRFCYYCIYRVTQRVCPICRSAYTL